MTRILGIDPGSRITGYGLIETTGNQHRYIDSGCIRCAQGELPERLGIVFRGVDQLIGHHHPEEFAIESVFMHRNAGSALKLGQARGAAICAAVNLGLPVHEYSPRQVKQAVVGKGSAEKSQVQYMMKILLKLSKIPPEDAADALAIALCHANMRQTLGRLNHQSSHYQRGRLR